MCIACGDPLNSPLVSTVTVAVSPRSVTLASPLPVTWFVGTGAAAVLNDSPAGAAGVVVELEALFFDELPPLSAITAMMMPPITTSPASRAGRYLRGEPPDPSPPPALGPGGEAGGPAGDCAGGGAAVAGGCALAAVTAGEGGLAAVGWAPPERAVASAGGWIAGLALVAPPRPASAAAAVAAAAAGMMGSGAAAGSEGGAGSAGAGSAGAAVTGSAETGSAGGGAGSAGAAVTGSAGAGAGAAVGGSAAGCGTSPVSPCTSIASPVATIVGLPVKRIPSSTAAASRAKSPVDR